MAPRDSFSGFYCNGQCFGVVSENAFGDSFSCLFRVEEGDGAFRLDASIGNPMFCCFWIL